VLLDEKGETHVRPHDSPELTHMGGISGSAVYVWDAREEAEDKSMFLGGFAYQAGENSLVFATHADHIRPNGSIE
jgi:hypothetical protein